MILSQITTTLQAPVGVITRALRLQTKGCIFNKVIKSDVLSFETCLQRNRIQSVAAVYIIKGALSFYFSNETCSQFVQFFFNQLTYYHYFPHKT